MLLLNDIHLLFLWSIQGRSWGEFSGRSLAMRRTWATFPPWLTQRWWRCFSARDVKLLPELCNGTHEDNHRLLALDQGTNEGAGTRKSHHWHWDIWNDSCVWRMLLCKCFHGVDIGQKYKTRQRIFVLYHVSYIIEIVALHTLFFIYAYKVYF